MNTRVERSEQEIFDELATVCVSPGFAHVIAYFYFRDHVIPFGDELKPEDYAKARPALERLIRTEISTLVGLMLRAPLDFTLPSPKRTQELIDSTEALLNELHEALQSPMRDAFGAAFAEGSRQEKSIPSERPLS